MSGPDIAASQAVQTMHNVPAELQQLWNMLSPQITPENHVISIDGLVYSCLNEGALDWMANQFSTLVPGPVKYVRDCVLDRVFLGPEQAFPPGSFMTRPDGAFVLVYPEEMNSIPSAAGPSGLLNEKVPRPPNAFILYRKDHHGVVKFANPGIHNTEISKIIGTQWQNESDEIRAAYKILADKAKEEHAEKHPDYQYQPRKPSEKKRRMSKKKAIAAQQVFGEDSTGQKNYLANFMELSGSWTDDRVGTLPASANLLRAVQHHNQQHIEHTVRSSGFRPTMDYQIDHVRVQEQVPWDSILDQHDEDVAEASFNL